MALGLKHGVVELTEHDPEWEVIAAQKIKQIWSVFGSLAINIQHIGSTAIRGIKAKPIIDIAIGVGSFDVLTDELFQRLDVVDVYKSVQQPLPSIILGGVRKNSKFPMNIHIVEINSIQWKNHIDFRDYMNRFQEKAIDYENLKIEMAARNPNDRDAYSNGKAPFIHQILREATLWRCLHAIPGYDKFLKIEPINKGQSNDKKYYIETIDGKRLLLRVTDIAEYDRKKGEYEMLERVYELGVPTPQPVDFGLCDGGKCVYSLSGWLDGEDAETLIPHMNEAEQYSTGLKAGAVLRKIHTLPAPDDAELWESRFQRKVQTRIDLYIKHNLKSENCEKIIIYLRDKQNIPDTRPQTFWHGDFNIGNHMIMPDGEIATFDYNYWNLDYGDPWWEFVIIPWGKEPPAHYFSGMIKGYFNNNPPREFFDMLSYYYACDALSALCYTFSGMENGYTPEDGKQHMENVLRWFDNMNNPVPTWYLNGYELWDVYDENRNKTGRLHERGKPMTTGDYHIIVHVWKHNSKGEWLIDKRAPRYGRDDIDGKWETTGGCAVAGDDSLSAALREAKEELGIHLNPEKGILFSSDAQKWEDGHTAFIDVWVFEYDESIDNIIFDEREVSEVMWASVDKIKAMMVSGEFLDYPYFEEMVEKWGSAK